MIASVARTLKRGDVVKAIDEIFTVASPPEVIKWGGRKTVRISVKDDHGRTRVLTGNDIERRLRRSA